MELEEENREFIEEYPEEEYSEYYKTDYIIDKELKEYFKDKFIDPNTTIKIDTSKFHYNNEYNSLMIKIGDNNLYNKIYRNYDLSCGHRSFTNLSQNYKYRQILELFKEEYKETILIDLYKIIFDFIKKELKCQFILVSNNNLENVSTINSVMNKLKRWDTGDEYLLNKNSDNYIKMWII